MCLVCYREFFYWNDELNGEKTQEWNFWLCELAAVKFIEIGRCLYKNPRDDNKAYSAVVYILCQTEDEMYARLIASKSRGAQKF